MSAQPELSDAAKSAYVYVNLALCVCASSSSQVRYLEAFEEQINTLHQSKAPTKDREIEDLFKFVKDQPQLVGTGIYHYVCRQCPDADHPAPVFRPDRVGIKGIGPLIVAASQRAAARSQGE